MTLSSVTLTLGMCSRVISSAHHLTERNIWVKFNENTPKGSGDIERTRISRENPLTCDHALSLGGWVMCPERNI